MRQEKKQARQKMVVLFMVCCASSGIVHAADVLGCPKGIMQGTIWPRFSVQYQDMTEKWNAKKGDMVDVSDGVGLQSKTLIQSDVRLGYGVSSRCDIGLEIKYASVETKKENQNGKTEKFNANGVTELWLAGKYFVVDVANPESVFNYVKVSLGGAVGYGVVDNDEALVSGMSSGCNKAQVGALLHGGLYKNLVEYSGHLIYEWRGDAAESDGVPGFTFARSGEDVPDVLSYQAVVEKSLGRWFEVKLGLTGWVATQKDDMVVDDSESQYTYRHNAMAGVQFFPMSNDYEKRKWVLQGSMPYAYRMSVAPDYMVKLIAMWTF